MPSCAHVRDNGFRCINPAQEGRSVCVGHDPKFQCGKTTKRGTKCKRRKELGSDTCVKHAIKTDRGDSG